MYGAAFWDNRYGGEEYVFGTEPNAFLAEHCGVLQDPVLSISEGEGRKADFVPCRAITPCCMFGIALVCALLPLIYFGRI